VYSNVYANYSSFKVHNRKKQFSPDVKTLGGVQLQS